MNPQTSAVNNWTCPLFRSFSLRAETDALHIALAAVHGMNYLVTWNCTHIANATLRARIEAVCPAAGYDPPIICTPRELLEDDNDT